MSDQVNSLTLDQRKAALNSIAGQIVACTKCPLATQGRTHPVPGAGPITAEIMFIGEGPGQVEDQRGLPFVGPSGKFLEELLAGIGLTRDQVFITNVVKCRPPENRDPLPIEVNTCTTEYLYHQIDLINPKVIATLGRFSMGLFFPNAKITAIHGQPKWEKGRAYLPLFHPAAVLRNMATLKPQAQADMKKILDLLKEYETRTKAAAEPPKPPANTPPAASPPTQLNLF